MTQERPRTFTLREIDRIIAEHSPPPAHAKALMAIPGLAPKMQALADLTIHRASVGGWANAEVEREKERRTARLQAAERKREDAARFVQEQLAVFGIELPDLSIGSLEAGWDRFVDGIQRQQRDDRLLGRESNPETVAAANEIRTSMDGAWDLDALVAKARARVEGVDPYAIDERTVQYMNEYSQRGGIFIPGEGSRPVMDPDLDARLRELGILENPGGEDAA